MYHTLILLISIGWVQAEIVAYDCADKTTELTKVSLLSVKPCQDPRNYTESSHRRIQLVQKRQYVPIHVYTCQVKVEQFVEHCGMHSHRSTVGGGFRKYIQHIDPDQCLKAHRFRHIDLNGLGAGVISKLRLNGTTEVSATLQGYADTNGKCEGVRFAIGGTQYTNVVVIAAQPNTVDAVELDANDEGDKIPMRGLSISPISSNGIYSQSDITTNLAVSKHQTGNHQPNSKKNRRDR